MEDKQPSANQNLTETAVQQQAGTNHGRLFVTILVSVLLTAMITGSALYFWQKSTNEKVIISLEQKISSLEGQMSTTENAEIKPQPETDLNSNWKMYTNSKYGYTLKYPPASTITTCNVNDSDWPIEKTERDYSPVSITPGDPCSPHNFTIYHYQNPTNINGFEFFKNNTEGLNCEEKPNNVYFCIQKEQSPFDPNEFFTSEYQVSKKLIEGKDAIYVNTIKTFGELGDFVYIPSNNNVMLYIHIGSTQITDQILSTLKLTD